ncbi:MAG: type II secretion system protein [Candidatus Omnitrophica bacterium]|nr:type II secretion system protein [Candidatus Omnitrophota bacterium]MDD5430353.1 type II secretion system protein [Candidatus Omnitrophota bacterium]
MKNAKLGVAKKAFTLVEIIIVMVITGVVLLGITATSLFFIRQVTYNTERYNIYGQINYALEDIRLRCISAIQVNSFFNATGETRDNFEFEGEANLQNITPDDLSDNAIYRYQINPANGDLVLFKNGQITDILIEGRFFPSIEFEYIAGSPPNTLKVAITAAGDKIPFFGVSNEVVQGEVIRFWYIEVVG